MDYPGRLHHDIPGWVPDGAVFHIRMRASAGSSLIDASGVRVTAVLTAAQFYHETHRWFCRLIVVMPDHVHAMLAFPRETSLSTTIKSWKGYLTRTQHIVWQEGYFDHRLRSREAADECWRYLRENPVRAGLVGKAETWKWAWAPPDALVPE